MKRVDTIKLKKLIKIGIKENQTEYNNSVKNKKRKEQQKIKKFKKIVIKLEKLNTI